MPRFQLCRISALTHLVTEENADPQKYTHAYYELHFVRTVRKQSHLIYLPNCY